MANGMAFRIDGTWLPQFGATLPGTQVVTNPTPPGGGTTTTTPPKAVFSSSVTDATAKFDASNSTQGSHPIASYAWAFGDGTSGTGVSTTHTYAKSGTYNVTLTVTAATDNLTNSTSGFLVASVPVPTGIQQTGSGISLFQNLSGASFSARWKAAGTNKISLQPSTTYALTAFVGDQGRYDGASDQGGASQGILGAGPTSIVSMNANSTMGAGAASYSNQYTVLQSKGRTNPVFDNFAIVGGAQAYVYGGLNIDNASNATVSNLLIKNVVGSSGSPPGETFYINYNSSSGGVFDTIEMDGSGSSRSNVSAWAPAAAMLGFNSVTGKTTLRRIYGHESKFSKSVAAWQCVDGGEWSDVWTVNTAIGVGFEEMIGTYNMYNPVFGGNLYDLHFGRTSAAILGKSGLPNIYIRNPVYLGTQSKLRVLLPSTYSGAGHVASGTANQATTANLRILRGSDGAGWTDVTASELIVDASYSRGVTYNITPVTAYTPPTWALQ